MRALNRKRGEVIASILENHTRHRMFPEPSRILGDFGCVHDEQVFFLFESVGDEVIDDPAAFIQEDRVLGMAYRKCGEIVGEQSVEPGRGTIAAHKKLAHVGDVEDTTGLADGFVFLKDPSVLNGHFPACEFDHAAAGGKVLVEKWSSHKARKL